MPKGLTKFLSQGKFSKVVRKTFSDSNTAHDFYLRAYANRNLGNEVDSLREIQVALMQDPRNKLYLHEYLSHQISSEVISSLELLFNCDQAKADTGTYFKPSSENFLTAKLDSNALDKLLIERASKNLFLMKI